MPYIVLFCSFLLRIAYVFYGTPITSVVWSDMSVYVRIAEQLARGEWQLSHFFQSIGYPLFLSTLIPLGGDWLTWLALLQAIASTGTLFFIYKTSRLAFGERVATWALVAASVHLPWVLLVNFVLTETFLTLFLSLNAFLSLKLYREPRPRFLSACLWALTYLCAFWLKGSFVFWGPLFVAALFWKERKFAYPAIGLIAGVTLVGLVGHGVLAKAKVGEFQMSSSAGGLNFVEGKCPSKLNIGPDGIRWHSPLYYQLDDRTTKTWDRPFQDSSYYFGEGLKCIAENPAVLITSLEGIPMLLYGNLTWPLNQLKVREWERLYELYFAGFILIGVFLFVVFAPRDGIDRRMWVLPVLALCITVYVFKSEARFRIPADVWLIPMAVYGWAQVRRIART